MLWLLYGKWSGVEYLTICSGWPFVAVVQSYIEDFGVFLCIFLGDSETRQVALKVQILSALNGVGTMMVRISSRPSGDLVPVLLHQALGAYRAILTSEGEQCNNPIATPHTCRHDTFVFPVWLSFLQKHMCAKGVH